MQNQMTEIDKAAKAYADKHKNLTDIVSLLNEQIEALQRAAMPDIRRAVAAVAEKESELVTLIEGNRGLFQSPKSVVFHGIRVGLRKGKGGIDWADDAALVALIRKHFPKQFAALVKVTEKPRAKALGELEVDDLKKLGCTVEGTEDMPYVKSTASDVDKIVSALLKSACGDSEAKEAA